ELPPDVRARRRLRAYRHGVVSGQRVGVGQWRPLLPYPGPERVGHSGPLPVLGQRAGPADSLTVAATSSARARCESRLRCTPSPPARATVAASAKNTPRTRATRAISVARRSDFATLARSKLVSAGSVSCEPSASSGI